MSLMFRGVSMSSPGAERKDTTTATRGCAFCSTLTPDRQCVPSKGRDDFGVYTGTFEEADSGDEVDDSKCSACRQVMAGKGAGQGHNCNNRPICIAIKPSGDLT